MYLAHVLSNLSTIYHFYGYLSNTVHVYIWIISIVPGPISGWAVHRFDWLAVSSYSYGSFSCVFGCRSC